MVDFDQALAEAIRVSYDIESTGRILLVRDILGRIRAVLDDRDAGQEAAARGSELAAKLSVALGPFSPDRDALAPVTSLSAMLTGTELFDSSDVRLVAYDGSPVESVEEPHVKVLERQPAGKAWTRPRTKSDPHRWIAFASFKGGVGRSTALTMLARSMVQAGQVVLAIDLDLESPGISSLLLAPGDRPVHGVVDVLVESIVGNESATTPVARSSVVQASRGNGELWVAPASGSEVGEYRFIPKLNRAYIEAPLPSLGREVFSFSDRLGFAVQYCVDFVERESREPDVVLLDCRAGLHEISSAVLTQLADFSLLFVQDTPQTWDGLGSLFDEWRRVQPVARDVRTRLKCVASMVPASSEDRYLADFIDRSAECFGLLYDDVPAGSSGADEFFSFAVDDTFAPHYPWPINHVPDAMYFDPVGGVDILDNPLVLTAFERFVNESSEFFNQERRR